MAVRASDIHDDQGTCPPGIDLEPVGAIGSTACLQRTLETEYASLLTRLAATLRSHDKASEALHDTYVRLGRTAAIGEVRSPFAYLYRMALNLAGNVRKRDRHILASEAVGPEWLVDEMPSPERSTVAKLDLERALAALAALPNRRRDIFLARWRDGLSHREIAEQLHIHKRTVQKELARAERFLKVRNE